MNELQQAVLVALQRLTSRTGIGLSAGLQAEIARLGATYVNFDIEHYLGVDEATRLALAHVLALRIGPDDHPSVQQRRAG